MTLFRFKGVTKRYEKSLVLRDVDFRLEEGERVGLIGKNGVGKTTVLKLILGKEHPDEGSLWIKDGIRIGYFSQHSELSGEHSIEEILQDVFHEVAKIERELDAIDHLLATNQNSIEKKRALTRQGELLEEMDRLDGWTCANRIDTVLTKLEFSEEHRTLPVRKLSGGWRNRAALAKILLEEPDLILLDEPMNFLDMPGVAWLEGWLCRTRSTMLVISHDRDFLNQVVKRVVEIENHQFQIYDGDYTNYVREKPTRLKRLQSQFVHEAELLAYESEAIANSRNAGRGDKSLRRKLADIKKQVEPKPVDVIITNLYERLRVPNKVCSVEGLEKTFGDTSIFKDVSFDLYRGECLGIVGPNGCGKTTFIQSLVDSSVPDKGKVKWFGETSYAYYNDILEDLDDGDTVTHAVNVVPMVYTAQRRMVNKFLSMLQFSEQGLKQKIGTLSGGQRARVALALCLLSGASVIVLDEPTNHLDITSTQVMERALLSYPGAVIVVSHDRLFLRKVTTRFLRFEGRGQGVTLSAE